MAYLVRIGAIPENASGVGSRGYHIFRRGSWVVVAWGAVEVLPQRRIHWCRMPRRLTHRLRTVKAAKAFRLRQIASQVDDGYSRLPVGIHILPQRKE